MALQKQAPTPSARTGEVIYDSVQPEKDSLLLVEATGEIYLFSGHHTKMQAAAPTSAPSSRAARRFCARNAERLRSRVLNVPQRPVRGLAKCSATQIVSNRAPGCSCGPARAASNPALACTGCQDRRCCWWERFGATQPCTPSVHHTLQFAQQPPEHRPALSGACMGVLDHNAWCIAAAGHVHGPNPPQQQRLDEGACNPRPGMGYRHP